MEDLYLLGEGEDDLDDEDIELLGELLGDDPILGQRAALHRRIRGRTGTRARARVRRAMVPKTPGVPTPGARELFLPFPAIQFTNTSALVLTMTSRPQRPFKGRRLVITATRSAGAAAIAVAVANLTVGAVQQPVATGLTPVETFAGGSFGVDLALDPATPGVEIVLTIQALAQPGVGETIDVTAVLIGLAIG